VHTNALDKQTASGSKKGISATELTASPFVKTRTRPTDRCENLMRAFISIKAWVCGRSPAGIDGSNPAGGMDVFLL
jgi:hypothetical protein